LQLQLLRKELVIVIEEGNPLRAGSRNAGVAGSSSADVLCQHMHVQARVLNLSQSLHRGPIGAILHHDHFNGLERLGQDTAHGTHDKLWAVVRWYNH
jgi:hypothetical protein